MWLHHETGAGHLASSSAKPKARVAHPAGCDHPSLHFTPAAAQVRRPVRAGVSGGEMFGVDLTRVALRAAMKYGSGWFIRCCVTAVSQWASERRSARWSPNGPGQVRPPALPRGNGGGRPLPPSSPGTLPPLRSIPTPVGSPYAQSRRPERRRPAWGRPASSRPPTGGGPHRREVPADPAARRCARLCSDRRRRRAWPRPRPPAR